MMNMPVVQKSMGCIMPATRAEESKQGVFEAKVADGDDVGHSEAGSGLFQCLARACELAERQAGARPTMAFEHSYLHTHTSTQVNHTTHHGDDNEQSRHAQPHHAD